MVFFSANAQLEFCKGLKGNPVFIEDFGKVSSKQSAKSIGETTYKFSANKPPKEGEYTVSSKFDFFPYWFDTKDHTDIKRKGQALIINASETDIQTPFFKRTIEGFCNSGTYEFSIWVLNIASSENSPCSAAVAAEGGIPVNLNFQIWNANESELLRSGSTGQIFSEAVPKWKRFGLVFNLGRSQESVVLKIKNYAEGGCGNDFVIDDITFSPCGVETLINSKKYASGSRFCEGLPEDFQLDFNYYKTNPDASDLQYQWEVSSDSINFKKIGELNAPLKYKDTLSVGRHFFRAKVGNDISSLSNSTCNLYSPNFKVELLDQPLPPKILNGKDFCFGETVILSAEKQEVESQLQWFDKKENGVLLSVSKNFLVENLDSGFYTYYVGSYNRLTKCGSELVEVSFKVNDVLPTIGEDETFLKCDYSYVTLDAGLDDVIYTWNTQDTTKIIEVDKPGKYWVSMHPINNSYCKSVKYFTVNDLPGPTIMNVAHSKEDNSLKVLLFEKGDFEYSINRGYDYQKSPVFKSVLNGKYEFRVITTDSCQAEGPIYRYTKLRDY